MKQAKHLSMIRGFHLADWFTLAMRPAASAPCLP